MNGHKRRTTLTIVLTEVGDYNTSGTSYPAADRYNDYFPSSSNSGYSARPALYIKLPPSELEQARDDGTKFEETTKIEDDSGDEVWIPGGFEIAEDSATDADDGVVIQDSAKGNQFVWVPVPDYTTMYEDTKGAVTLKGVTTQTSVYSKLRVRTGDGFTVTTPGNEREIREPDVLRYYDTESQYYSILGCSSTKDMADKMVSEYTATYNSIKKYKGFYIGRYEIGGSVSSPTLKKGQTVLSGNWYNLKKACTNIVSSSYAQSEMIYGNQWDETMSWIIRSGEKTEEEVNEDSGSWGNYLDSTGAATTNSGSKQTSGKNEAWKANNVYDLAGNYYEWTQEAYSTDLRIFQGRLLLQFRY